MASGLTVSDFREQFFTLLSAGNAEVAPKTRKAANEFLGSYDSLETRVCALFKRDVATAILCFQLVHPVTHERYFSRIQDACDMFQDGMDRYSLTKNELWNYLQGFAGRATPGEIYFLASYQVARKNCDAVLKDLRKLTAQFTLSTVRALLTTQYSYVTRQKKNTEKPSVEKLLSILAIVCDRYSYSSLELMAANCDFRELLNVEYMPCAANEPLCEKDGHLAKTLSRKEGAVNWIKTSTLPKALFLVATYDENGALSTENIAMQVRAVNSAYNVRVRYVEGEKQLWQIIERTIRIAAPQLIVIAAHGEKKGIQLGEKSALEVTSDKIRAITVLTPLPARASIVLHCCSTGEGKQGTANLANWFATCAPHVKVFAGAAPVKSSSVIFRSFAPLDVKFYTEWKVSSSTSVPVDVTYVVRPVAD